MLLSQNTLCSESLWLKLVQARNQDRNVGADKVDAETKKAIEDAVAELKEVVEGDDAEAIAAKTQALTDTAMKLGEAIYKAQMEEAQASEGASGDGDDGDAGSKKDDDVVDADFEDVTKDDDGKKAS